MTTKAYKTLVGVFVIVGIALFAAGIIFLGGGKFFRETLSYTLYFDGSVSGLSVGAPVVFRGVPMGSVTQISLVANARDSSITIPVRISIDNSSFLRPNGDTLSIEDEESLIQRMIERGLRARLQMASLITGQYRVELDFFPNTPINYRSSSPASEIPTIPSPIDTLQRLLARIPIDKIADSLTTVLANLTDAVGQGQLRTALDAFTDAFRELRKLLADSGLSESLGRAMGSVDDATKSLQKELPAALQSFRDAMDGLTRAAGQLRALGASADAAIGKDSPTMNDLRRLLREASAAARSLHNFADMLERNPEALLYGRHGKR